MPQLSPMNWFMLMELFFFVYLLLLFNLYFYLKFYMKVILNKIVSIEYKMNWY
uniref:ATP synthase F0 subunit 8 n=1 Tax=Phanerotoma flava TaxID=684660 RepID=D8WHA5_9HYME|nr:ATP synthase F0 subunit 8 [Phanerotoma flava]